MPRMNENRLKIISISAIAIFMVILPLFIVTSPFTLHLITIVGIYTILGTSLRLAHTADIWFVGPAAFLGMGAYGVAILMLDIGLSFLQAVPIVCIGVVLFAWGFGYATLRVKGIYLAILSLALVEALRLTWVYTFDKNRAIMVPPAHFFGIDLATKVEYYYLVWAILAITLVILHRVEKSHIGAVLKSIAQDESLAMSLGIKTLRYKVIALCVFAFFAAIAGICFATYNMAISNKSFTVWASMLIVIQMVVGGRGSIWGPMVGAALLTIVPHLLGLSPFLQKITYSSLVIAVLYFLPGGLTSLLPAIWKSLPEGIRSLARAIQSLPGKVKR